MATGIATCGVRSKVLAGSVISRSFDSLTQASCKHSLEGYIYARCGGKMYVLVPLFADSSPMSDSDSYGPSRWNRYLSSVVVPLEGEGSDFGHRWATLNHTESISVGSNERPIFELKSLMSNPSHWNEHISYATVDSEDDGITFANQRDPVALTESMNARSNEQVMPDPEVGTARCDEGQRGTD